MIQHQIDPKLKIKKLEDLIDLPFVVLVNKFDEASAKEFRDSFSKAINTGQKIIPIVIDSYGGQAYSLLSMVAAIKASPVPVATIVSGKAMSCGSILFTCGTEGYRFMDPFATVLIHDVGGHSVGKVEEIKADAKESERINQLVYRMMAKNCGKDEEYFLKLVHDHAHADWFLNAEECKSHNITNHIRIPSFKVKISTDITFE
jgi:ATP-dependent Clp protease, protease subunit